MTNLEFSNIERQHGLLSYVTNEGLVTLKSDVAEIPPALYSACKRECKYIEPTHASLLIFCSEVTALTHCTGIYTVGPKIHLDDKWFVSKAELIKYLASHEEIPVDKYDELVALLESDGQDCALSDEFERISGVSLFVDGETLTCCGTTFSGKEALLKFLKTGAPANFAAFTEHTSTVRKVLDGLGIVLDEVAFVASNSKAYKEFDEDMPIKGVMKDDGEVAWLSVDRSKFTPLKTDHGDCYILNTLKKKTVKTLYSKVYKTDLFVTVRPYPIGILPDDTYAFAFKGKDGDPVDKEEIDGRQSSSELPEQK